MAIPSTEQRLSAAPHLLPVVRELPADLESPVSVYLKLAGRGPSFLLESVTGGEQVARYSFIGTEIRQSYVLRGRELTRRLDGRTSKIEIPPGGEPLAALRGELAARRRDPAPGLPRFAGGLAGYLAYDAARYFEPVLPPWRHPALPDAIYLQADTVVAFDHAFGRLILIANPDVSLERGEALAEAEARLDRLEAQLGTAIAVQEPRLEAGSPGSWQMNFTAGQFEAAVTQAKERIAAGDIFQVVLSQRMSRPTAAAPFDIYRALRRVNPSPYMFFFDFDTVAQPADGEPLRLIGASPEMHVRLEGRRATVRPIAGTRPRGRDVAEDARLEEELVADPKERAEHVMLVDLGRNDLGRVCEAGSVRVPELMQVERYSHVMHLVSRVEGELSEGLDGFDLMRATFPAGTVSGAPKIRAMQIIGELEGEARGPYAGAVGYFSYDGSLDTCITIRTLVMQGDVVQIQAGAGIVADSDPAKEYQETLNKARALAQAVERAEGQRGAS